MQTEINTDELLNAWESLSLNLEEGRCICVIGSLFYSDQTFEVSADGQTSQTLNSALAHHLSNEISGEIGWVGLDHFYAAKQLQLSGKSDLLIRKKIRLFLNEHSERVLDLPWVKEVSKLNVPLYIYLGYDDILAEAIKKHSGREAKIVSPYDEGLDNIRTPTIDAPIVFNVFGSLPVIQANTRIHGNRFAAYETELYPLLKSIDLANKSSIPKNIANLVAQDDVPFLILGVGFHKWYIRFLFGLFLSRYEQKEHSLALESASFFDAQNEDNQDLILYGKTSNLIRWKWGKLDYSNLNDQLSNLPKYAPEKAPFCDVKNNEDEFNVPNVFVSFRDDGLEAAQYYTSKLIENSIRVFGEKRLVSSGAEQAITSDWENNVANIITDTCHFFIIVVSKKYNDTASGKNAGRKELAIALEHSDNVTGRQYFFCVRGTEKIRLKHLKDKAELLSNIHTIDIYDENELNEHIEEILTIFNAITSA